MDNDIINQNTVKALNQVKKTDCYYGDPSAKTRIMFIGNSITRHEPKPEIGWDNNWGMAASSLENDYVHQVMAHFDDVYACTISGNVWESDFVNKEKANAIVEYAKEFKPDILIVRFGENSNRQLISEGTDVLDAWMYLLSSLKDAAKITIVTSMFWRLDAVDEAIKHAANELDLKYVDISDLGADQSNMAIGLFEHYGVSIHPGDLGMKRIAERIIEAL